MSKDSHASALRRHTGQFRRSLLQLTSAGLALLATTMALATWTREGAAASWFLPAAGAAVAAGAFFAATRRLSALAAQILAYGGGLAMAAILLLGESSLLSAAAKLALTAIVATFTLTAPRREALVFDGLAIALVLSAPLVRGTPADELASAIAASTLEAAALGLLCAAAAAIGR